MQNINDEIRDFLDSTDVKQYVLALEAGVSTATICRAYRNRQDDMRESNARSIRAAMLRLRPGVPTTTPTSQPVPHATASPPA